MRRVLTLWMASAFCCPTAQSNFISQGAITFERTINIHVLLPTIMKESWKMNQDAIDIQMPQMCEQIKQFQKDEYELLFDPTKSIYHLLEKEKEKYDYDGGSKVIYYFDEFSTKNTIYNNFASGETIAEKWIGGEMYYIKDSIKNIEWKITEEICEIVGHQCRRANALVADSIYVVAFYTDDILTSGGPESLHGLPGMILGVALPHFHITYFAKSVKLLEATPEKLKMPKPQRFPYYYKALLDEFLKKSGRSSSLNSGWERKLFKI